MRRELCVYGSLSHSQLLHVSHPISLLLPLTRSVSMYLLYPMSFKCTPATSSGAHMEEHQSAVILEEQLDGLFRVVVYLVSSITL